jgi:hypothetical protein
MRRIVKPLLFIAGSLLVLLLSGYFITGKLVHKKVDEALRKLPPSLKVTYNNLQFSLFNGSLTIGGLAVTYSPEMNDHRDTIRVNEVDVEGIRFFELLRSRRLHIGTLRLVGCIADLDEDLADKKPPVLKDGLPFEEMSIGNLEAPGLEVRGQRGSQVVLFKEGYHPKG